MPELGQPRSPAITQCGLKRAEKFGHFAGRVAISRANSDGDSGREQRPGLIDIVETNQQLRQLKIAGHIIGMVAEQLSEVLLRDIVLTIRGTAHRQAVSQKRIVRVAGEKLFELFTS